LEEGMNKGFFVTVVIGNCMDSLKFYGKMFRVSGMDRRG
jgi:hypothetical protein